MAKLLNKGQQARALALLQRLTKAVGNCEDTASVLSISKEAEELLKEVEPVREYMLQQDAEITVEPGRKLILKAGSHVFGNPYDLKKLGFKITE